MNISKITTVSLLSIFFLMSLVSCNRNMSYGTGKVNTNHGNADGGISTQRATHMADNYKSTFPTDYDTMYDSTYKSSANNNSYKNTSENFGINSNFAGGSTTPNYTSR